MPGRALYLKMKLFLNRASADQVDGLLEVGLGLAAEADDEIAGHGRVRNHFADSRQHFAVEGGGVAPLHPPQDGLRAALGRNVQVGRDLRQIAHRLQQIVGHVPRVIGDELDAADAGHVVDQREQVGQQNRLSARSRRGSC